MNPIEQLKNIIQELEQSTNTDCSNIGIGITTHNRQNLFNKSFEEIKRLAPKGAIIVVVDDASTTPNTHATYRFNQNVGIAGAKNKCLELLYLKGCEHFFLFDDDTYPLKENWFVPYVNSKEPHLNYIFQDFATGRKINDSIKIYQDSEIVAYTNPRGCMMYYHRSVLDEVGGMTSIFGKWGYEHPDLSNRIFNAGLTSFRFMDVVNSKGLFYNDDEYNENKNSSVSPQVRGESVNRNKGIYESRINSVEFVPFIEVINILLTCYFTNVKDTQRNEQWTSNILDLDPLINSTKDKVKLVVLHDCFTDDDINRYPFVDFVKVETFANPYFQRWISYYQYIRANEKTIDNIFCVDATDVELLNIPDWDNLGDNIYCGDENEVLQCQWMIGSHPDKVIQEFIKDNHGKQLLNAGIVGGEASLIKEFCRLINNYYSNAIERKVDLSKGDMGAFNYVARICFGDSVINSGQVCTRFKAGERNNFSWFKHK